MTSTDWRDQMDNPYPVTYTPENPAYPLTTTQALNYITGRDGRKVETTQDGITIHLETKNHSIHASAKDDTGSCWHPVPLIPLLLSKFNWKKTK